MALSSRSPRRGDGLARLQPSDPAARLQSGTAPWARLGDDVVSGPDLDLADPDRRHPRFEDPAWLPDEDDGPDLPQSPGWDRPAAPRWLDPAEDADTGEAPSRPRTRDRRRRELLMAPPAAIALVVIGLLACVVTVYTVVSGSSDEAPTVVAFPSSAGAAAPSDRDTVAATSENSSSAPRPSPSGAPAEGSAMVVSVVGLVKTPGLVHLSTTARIADAIAAAGGGRPGADLLSLNMAQPVRDGDQILVGFADPSGGPRLRSAVVSGGGAAVATTPGDRGPSGSAPSSAASGSGGASGSAGTVDLNTADEAALDTLPGVGPVTAAAIVEWRTRNGRFTSVDQLAEVDGIGPGRLAKLRDRVSVGAG
ncbi:ComEA family DNA-binding protein [Williamsia sp. MIQD14]|uniref:ComEA family DNA-binding protein n=1 Tax=Williamsia sp. MIQD14 TaxID=3425703 RepID=UPI003DA16B36